MPTLIPFGSSLAGIDPSLLNLPEAKRMLAACMENRDFEVIELRSLRQQDDSLAEVIVVKCICDQVPSRNQLGIKAREVLALVCAADFDKAPQVRALRSDFPLTIHQNQVSWGEPKSLCLYFEWTNTRRTWTPQKHLQRILWWLSAIARGELHGSDQAVEQLFFDSPYDIIFPPDFIGKLGDASQVLSFELVKRSDGRISALLASFTAPTVSAALQRQTYHPIIIDLPPIVHGVIVEYATNFEALNSQLAERGVELLAALKSAMRACIPPSGLPVDDPSYCLLLLRTPIRRTIESEPEKTDVRAILLSKELGPLGEQLGVFWKNGASYFAPPTLTGTVEPAPTGLRDIIIMPLEVKELASNSFARKASGIDERDAEFKGILAGVGALGSCLAEIWAQEAWGEWTYIDPDIIKAHNVVRHISKRNGIGHFKSDVVKCDLEAIYPAGGYNAYSVPADVTDWSDKRVEDAVTRATFGVDVTTTLEVPRDLSRRDQAPRLVSVFLTPSGEGAVLMIEDAERLLRLDALEAQYYRAIINSDWGSSHLQGHFGQIWVGAGCRDVSRVISTEDVRLHAALLAKQIRIHRAKSQANIAVWSMNSSNGEVTCHAIGCHTSYSKQIGPWRVVWDDAICEKLTEIRAAHLPSETGGVVFGYVDHVTSSIFVVDISGPTSDSEGNSTGFIRGVEGLSKELERVSQATAGIVQYIGEWHSHPKGASAQPSADDYLLVAHLASKLSEEGEPAVMLIIAAGQLCVAIQGGRS